jgi:hypothetical protein
MTFGSEVVTPTLSLPATRVSSPGGPWLCHRRPSKSSVTMVSKILSTCNGGGEHEGGVLLLVTKRVFTLDPLFWQTPVVYVAIHLRIGNQPRLLERLQHAT